MHTDASGDPLGFVGGRTRMCRGMDVDALGTHSDDYSLLASRLDVFRGVKNILSNTDDFFPKFAMLLMMIRTSNGYR